MAPPGGGGGGSLDPIDRSPLGHLIKFTNRSFPFYFLGLGTAFTD